MTVKFDTNKHSVFLLCYYLILKAEININSAINKTLIEQFNKISKNFYVKLYEWQYDQDIVYIKFFTRPSTCLSKFINAYKSASSRIIRKNFKIKVKFWSKSYCLLTDKKYSDEHLNKYIRGIKNENCKN